MPRMEIELTGSRPEGDWTWRAAGARQPKGMVAASVVPAGAKVGDVFRAETVADLDGITVLSLTPPRARQQSAATLVVVGSGDPRLDTEPRVPRRGVAADAAAAGPRPPSRPPGRERPERRERPHSPGPGRGEGEDRRRREGPPRRGPATGRESGERTSERRERRTDARPERPAATHARRTVGERPGRPERGPAPRPAAVPRPRPRRLVPGRARRDAVLDGLAPLQRQIAEQVLRGGIPAVRHAVERQNEAARADGRPEIQADALLAMAEDLLPVLLAADWHDRAEAAVAIVDEVGLRDLRAVVVGPGADIASRDEACRSLASTLRDALARREKEEHQVWLDDITSSLSDGRVVRALRISGRPPQPGMRLREEVRRQLAAGAAQAMAPKTTNERWMAVLEATASSAVRRHVVPAGAPEHPSEDLRAAIARFTGRVPGLADMAAASEAPAPVEAVEPATATTEAVVEASAPTPEIPAATESEPPDDAEVTPTAEAVIEAADVPEQPEAAASAEPPGDASGDDGDDAVVGEELGQSVHQG